MISEAVSFSSYDSDSDSDVESHFKISLLSKDTASGFSPATVDVLSNHLDSTT